jgi:hypothetical protein
MRNGNNSPIHYKDYVAGWLDSSIHDFLGHFPTTSKSMEFALITSLDSNPAPSSLLGKSPALRAVARDAKPLKEGILLPTALMLEAHARNQIFFGFDEVWFFPDDKIKPKPESAWLVGPNRIDQRQLDKLGSWMSDNGCSLGLGDGCGLNLIMKARGLVKYLIAYSMSQPQPTAGGEAEKL